VREDTIIRLQELDRAKKQKITIVRALFYKLVKTVEPSFNKSLTSNDSVLDVSWSLVR